MLWQISVYPHCGCIHWALTVIMVYYFFLPMSQLYPFHTSLICFSTELRSLHWAKLRWACPPLMTDITEVLFRKNKNIRNTVQLWIRLLHWKAFKRRQQTGGTININHGAMICLCTVSAVHVLFSASRVRQRVTAGPRCFKPCCEKCHMHICLRMNNEKTCNYITEASWDTPFTCV